MGRKRKHNKTLPQSLYFNHGSYFYVKNNRWINLGKNRAKAFLRYTELTSDTQSPRLMKDILVRYQKEEMNDLDDDTKKNKLRSLRNLTLIFGHMYPEDIKPKDVYRYMDERQKQSVNGANKDKSCLNQVFKAAIRWGITETNPCVNIAGLKEKPRDRLIAEWEFRAVQQTAPLMIQFIMEFAYLTKARQGEILPAKRSNIAEEGIYLLDTKSGGRFYLVEWSAQLKSLVNAVCLHLDSQAFARALRRSAQPSDDLFPSTTGKAYTKDGFKKVWGRLLDNAIATGLIEERFTFHDIRAMAVTHTHDKEGLEAASKAAGHASLKITKQVYVRGVQRRKPTA